MLQLTPWRLFSILAICLTGFVYALPNFLSPSALDAMPSWWPKKTLSLGLDLKGGSYLLLEANVDELRREWETQIEDDIRQRLRKARIQYTGLGRSGSSAVVRITKPENSD